jgi:uncharacterized protein (TIGR02271 family)
VCSTSVVGQPVLVSGKDGWRGIVHSWFGASPGNTAEAHAITIRLDTGETVIVPDTVLTGRPDGSYYVPLSLDELRAGVPLPTAKAEPRPEPEPGREAAPPPREPQATASSQELEEPPLIIPVIHEQLEIGKRKVQTGAGVRIEKIMRDEEQVVDLPLVHEQVEVERVAVDRILDGPVPVRHVGDTIIVPVVQEVLVVQKQLRLVEELHIRKTRTEKRDPRTVVLKKEEATVERLEGARAISEENQGGTDDLRPV